MKNAGKLILVIYFIFWSYIFMQILSIISSTSIDAFSLYNWIFLVENFIFFHSIGFGIYYLILVAKNKKLRNEK